MKRRRHINVRRRHLEGWGDEHRGFPWYGVHWAWHVLFIWPAALYVITWPIRAAIGYSLVSRAREPAG